MKNKPLDIAGFLKLVIDALDAAGVEYLIGGAIAEWAWGEPRATQDLDLVVKIPIKAINKLSKELKKRDVLIPAEIILGFTQKSGESVKTSCCNNAVRTLLGIGSPRTRDGVDDYRNPRCTKRCRL